jgi:hypothetical protein
MRAKKLVVLLDLFYLKEKGGGGGGEKGALHRTYIWEKKNVKLVLVV